MRVPLSGWRPGSRAAPDAPHALTPGGALDSRWLLGLQAASLLAMAVTVGTRLWQDHVWFGFLLVAVAAVCWAPELTRRRFRRWWFFYVAGIFLYTLLRSYADETAIPIRTTYVIRVDKWMFLGHDPVVWLQTRLFSPDGVTWLDRLAVAVHWSFFVAPHAAAVAIVVWRRPLFPRYAMLIVLTMYAGLVLFFLVPTSPPWLAAQAGELPNVYRVMDFVGGQVGGSTYDSFYASLGEPNSVAAMPSIHEGVTFAMYLWARDQYPRLAWPLLAYSAIMAAALVYLAEHYALDILAGVLVATACHLAARRLVPAAAPAKA